MDAAREADRQHVIDALQYLDQAIREIRDHAFVTGRREIPPGREPPDGAR